MRSLSKNISLLEDILLTVKKTPNVIAISETKLNDNSRQNVNIPGYTFLNTNSKTAAGGVGLYVSEDLEFVRRRDLDLCMDGVECCWIELSRKRQEYLDWLFFATTSGPYTESALPFLDLLDVLTVDNVYRLHALKFTHLQHKGLLPSLFDNLFQYASYRHIHTIQGMHRGKTSVNRVLVLTLENKCFPIKQ